jgi:hypothetical protein
VAELPALLSPLIRTVYFREGRALAPEQCEEDLVLSQRNCSLEHFARRNDVAFNKVFWSEPRFQQHIWEQLLDYGRLEWSKTLKKYNTALPEQRANILRSFDSVWTRRNVMCSRTDLKVRWHLIPPSNLLISW